MSEYNAPFKSILEIEKLKLMNNSQAKKSIAIEKLYINKDASMFLTIKNGLSYAPPTVNWKRV